MSASIIAITSANTTAAIAVAEQQKAINQCREYVSSFDANGASQAAMQAYAKCVDTLYPVATTSGDDIYILRILVISVIIGAIIGGVQEYRSGYTSAFDVFWMAFLFAILAPCVVAIIIIFCYGFGAAFL